MAAIAKTAANVDTPNTFQSIRGQLGANVAPGDWVYLDGTNGWKLAVGTSAAAAHARGLVVSDGFGSTAFLSGQTVDIVTYGKVKGFASMTPGAPIYISAGTAGAGDHTAPATAGQFVSVAGWAESADTVFVAPQATLPAEVPGGG